MVEQGDRQACRTMVELLTLAHERACEVEIIARGLDEEPAPIEDEVVQSYAARAKAQRASPEFGMTDWKAALRLIEGKGSDWRQ